MSDARCPPFTRCADANGQWRSICMSCYLTVAREDSEAELCEGEEAHDCGQFFTAKRTNMSVRPGESESTKRRASGC
jgi:hypothetical protein